MRVARELTTEGIEKVIANDQLPPDLEVLDMIFRLDDEVLYRKKARPTKAGLSFFFTATSAEGRGHSPDDTSYGAGHTAIQRHKNTWHGVKVQEGLSEAQRG
jgi:hypothetical protein